uniref:Uncharacterized protein n=1 Tax=Tetranychus urticae TaxID=32264 RepID=T1K8N7_TETUR
MLARRPFDCRTCRISIHLSMNTSLDNYPLDFNISYGFMKTLFPAFIDYTAHETVLREDKSDFHKINSSSNPLNQTVNSSESQIYLDDNFFGGFDQHFLIGYDALAIPGRNNNQTSTNETSSNLRLLSSGSQLMGYRILFSDDPSSHSAPLVTYTLCYSLDKSYGTQYIPLTTCYPYVNENVKQCVCWETTNWKTYFFPSIKKITEYELPDAPVACKNVSQIRIRCGRLVNKRLPGYFDINLIRANGSSIGSLQINRSTIWSSNSLMSSDVTDLLIDFYSVRPLDKPRFIEITFHKSPASKVSLIYLYGLVIKSQDFYQVYPYCHYLQHNRNVRLSDSADWSRAMTRINMITSLPITLQRVQSLTWLERCLISIFIIQYLASKLLSTLETHDQNYITASLVEGVGGAIFLYTWVLLAYIAVFKRHNSDRYNLMSLSSNHQLFNIIGSLLVIVIIIEVFNAAVVINKSYWRGETFNLSIASNYTSTITGLIIESIIFRFYKPDKSGPMSFDLGYDASTNAT